MSKKRLQNDPLAFIKDSRKSKGQNEPAQKLEVKSSRIGLPEGWDRRTVIMRDDHISKLETIAFLDNRTLKDVLDEALELYLKDKNVPTREELRRT
jgi:hypothetical protein